LKYYNEAIRKNICQDFPAFFIALLLLPVFFKDQIKALIFQEFEKATEATIYFDLDQFSVSLIKNFPSATITVFLNLQLLIWILA
jgi:hypothetical protein